MAEPVVELTVRYPDFVGKASLGKKDCRVTDDDADEVKRLVSNKMSRKR